jgi:23S rRNA (adenine2030-N6)-methyltransferase
MLENLNKIGIRDWLNVNLTVQTPNPDGFGMHGSGMFIVNPPWTLPAILKETIPVLTKLLAIDEKANFELTSQIT